MTILTDKNIARFWSKVYIGDKNECWLWLASTTSGGYGFFRAGKSMNAHRFSLMLKLNNEDLNGMCLHSCDNPKCVNPNHLHLGTNSENIKQAYERNLIFAQKGESHGRSILTEKDVLWIRENYPKGGHTHRSLAKQFGVGATTIKDVLKRKKWNHI